MIRTVNLHGNLAELYGRDFRLDVASAAEAVRALCVQLRGFRQTVAKGEFQVLVGGAYLDEEELPMEIGPDTQIDIVPVPVGSKNSGGWIKVILGVALLGYGLLLGGSTGLFGIGAKTFIQMGAGLALSGLGLLLSPTPTLSNSEKPDDLPSYVFNGALNITEEGNCIPLCYGTFLCGSLVVSSGLSIEDYSKVLDTGSVEDATQIDIGQKKGN